MPPLNPSPVTIGANAGQLGVGVVTLGAGLTGQTTTHVIQANVVGACAFSLTVQGRVVGASVWMNVPYVLRASGAAPGSAGIDAVVADTALTADFLIKVDSTGLEIALTVGSVSGAGSLAVEYAVINGAAA